MTTPQYDRLKRLNERLNQWGGRPVPKAELLRLTSVSERTFKEDLALMREEFQAPIQYCRRTKGFYYASQFDLMASVALNDRDVQTLETAVAALAQFKDLPLFAELRGTVDKIESAVRFRVRPSPQAQRIQFESVPYFQNIELIEPLLHCIVQQQVVEFDYQKHDQAQAERYDLHPYLIKEYRNRWYVLGHCPKRHSLRIFGLDRIVANSLQSTGAFFDEPDFDASQYFAYTLGIAVYDQQPEEVVLSMTPGHGRFFKSQPFFAFQPDDILMDTPKEFRIRFPRISINKELVMELVRWGNQIRVVSPESLRQKVVEYLQRALNQYET
ncbi:helix-turn-helix transcriptional regulator [Arundinibacter roseus]|uniref:WYL domain-containing protein n=1 Tax=Arundinibacter roseus TaxID=2070510 RepID=A0A4R4KLQ2_9BACT|nr:WYL domain-containing protein [Arundinibacter roseus]TDB67896.1 WYL domain-containing protein [Arundinibacter roseus]